MKASRIPVLLLLAALSLALPAVAGDPPAAGEKAPAFSLPASDGSTVTLEQFRGKWVVLYFYPKDFTSGCTVEARNFQRDAAKYEKANTVVLGVSVDSVDSHREFCAKEGLGFRLLSDTGKTATKAPARARMSRKRSASSTSRWSSAIRIGRSAMVGCAGWTEWA